MRIIKDIEYGTASDSQRLDIYLPTETDSVFIYFHGGGLEGGDKKFSECFAHYLNEKRIAVVSANYRMYPEAKYPDFIYDAADAVAWSVGYAKKELGCNRIYIGGSSAGGYLSMMLCFDGTYLARAGVEGGDICGYFHDAGQPTAHFNVLKKEGLDSRRIIVDESAPLYYVGLSEEYPPMRFIVSDNDMENRYEQTMLMLSTLKHFGYSRFDHTLVHGKHCEYCCKMDEHGESIFAKMIYEFIKKTENSQF